MRNLTILLALASTLLFGCGKNEDAYSGIPSANQAVVQQPQTVQQQPMQQAPTQPVVINNEQSSLMPALLGAAAGYMLGSSGSNNQPRVVEREVIREVPTRSAGGYGPGYGPRGQTQIGSAVKPPMPSAPSTPAFTAPAVPKPVAVAPKPSYSQGGYGSTTYSNAKPATPSVSYGSSFKPSTPAASPKPSYSSGSYRSGSTSYSSSRSSSRR